MNKYMIAIISAIIIVGAILTAVVLFDKNEKTVEPQTIETKLSEEIIEDECTEEYKEMKRSEIIQVASEEVKTSPNCFIILKKIYSGCGHTIEEYINLPNDLVNLTKEEIQNVYQGWNIEKFESNEIVLNRKLEGECEEHYIVKDENNRVSIYRILENGEEELVEKTDIYTDYLPNEDKNNMKNGIRANGKKELNQVLENFE